MKGLMKTNCYDVEDTMIIVGSCLQRMQPKAYNLLLWISPPHCIQLHYIESEIRKAMNCNNLEIIHYVAVNNKLIKVSDKTIKKSKSLAELEQI